MLTELLHRLAARASIYDRIQTLAGNQQLLKRLSQELAPLNPKVVVDIGGGTGTVREILTSGCKYICVDLEMPKLIGFRRKASGGLAVMANVTAIPIKDSCVDLIICKSVTHHLTDVQLDRAFEESRRILRKGGYILVFDAVWNPSRIAGRLLWALDRGSYPRASEGLRKRFGERFDIKRWEKLLIHHEYVLGVGVRS
jgi:ubiquinone/menaquinone biosynthesis C-methylase UbiE